MTSRQRLATLAALVLATAAAPADMLPLKHGIFVPANIACRGASNVDMVNYWGGRSSIGVAQATCTIKKVPNRARPTRSPTPAATSPAAT